MAFKVCGPKLALCGIIISIWGIIQLAFLGVFFHIRAVLLVEDIGLPHEAIIESSEEFYHEADELYDSSALNCWIAALIYLITLLFSGQQFWSNKRRKGKKTSSKKKTIK